VGRPETFFPAHDLTGVSHLILLGYSYKVDTEALHQAVVRFPGYIGLICSRLKRREMFAKLRERGVAESALERIEAPLGVAIGAETPAEIAVSILGSIIQSHKRANSVSSSTPASEVTDVEEEESGKVQPIRQQRT
jgi:xanthine dehydrogenase accessory factor